MKDIIKLLYNKEISAEEANNILDGVFDRFHRKKEQFLWAEEVGFSEYEATAYAQNASISDLAIFRYEGWPNRCSKCKRPLDYKEYGWWIDHDKDGMPQLHHLKCPQE